MRHYHKDCTILKAKALPELEPTETNATEPQSTLDNTTVQNEASLIPEQETQERQSTGETTEQELIPILGEDEYRAALARETNRTSQWEQVMAALNEEEYSEALAAEMAISR
ncbi:hypothetical protein JQC92_21955 [Shewanella sp. 202IG2-18]|uniref:hypothetical protein n=1 Tax=Parashewanella hymeniacidonis TaxID=2807618 RepID=UPI001962224F|nr:hypothetical protein [Parashewanella hymeniacidonis]MBM7074641.1 hypothetical protein [Parashewanella hymeniacidonis]